MRDFDPKKRQKGSRFPPQAALPDVFRYLELKSWLADAVECVRASDSSFTHRVLSERLGFRSSGALILASTGQRRVAPETARRIGALLGYSRAQQEQLALLATFDRAATAQEKAEILDKMRAARNFVAQWEGTLNNFDYFRHWYLPVLREIVALDDFREDAQWIGAKIEPQLSAVEVEQGLAELLRMGMLFRDQTGRLRQAQPVVATHSEIRSSALVLHQQAMMRLAARALEAQSPEVRDMRVITTAISRNQADRIKSKLEAVQKEITAIISEDEPIEVVYQLNTQWFALTSCASAPTPGAGQLENEEEDHV